MLGVMADIHGNSWALQAVLEDGAARGVASWVNLGDLLYGPLDPSGTFQLLQTIPDCVTISGNQDRLLTNPGSRADEPTVRLVLDLLGEAPLRWLATHPHLQSAHGALLFHGTPASDTVYLLEDVSSGSPQLRPESEITHLLAPHTPALALCGHSHIPRCVQLAGGALVVNPGSVGLPAYDDNRPVHDMETYSPHASYATLVPSLHGWNVSFHRVAYDWRAASEAARRHQRADWAFQVATGRARPAC